ncbi:MAG TPA: GIY-YIG nuclease family protein [Candidatus Binatia bacterium]|nr:GIY-YIG nuclease family protein [Candidatus Binatia bacterium]
MKDGTPLQRLEYMGFRKVGAWSHNGEVFKCALTDLGDSANILYAFVSNGSVLYIGKTVQPLKRRMYGYQNPALTQSTNIKANKLIKEVLGASATVEIYALPDNGLLYYGGFHVNLAAGLEDNLIKALAPPWNRGGA